MRPVPPGGAGSPAGSLTHDSRAVDEPPCAGSPARARTIGPANRLRSLLRDLGPLIHTGNDRWSEPLARHATGVPDVDDLLGGGFPRGRLSEIAGPRSSGRTSLTLALLAQTTRAGECASLIDWADAFDPDSASSAGVRLDRVLWVRTREWRESLRCVERLLETAGFPLVLLDVPNALSRIPEHAWLRLARRAAATQTALVLSTAERLAGPHAEIALTMERCKAHFSGSPPLLEGLEVRADLVRHRSAPLDRTAPIRLDASPAIAERSR